MSISKIKLQETAPNTISNFSDNKYDDFLMHLQYKFGTQKIRLPDYFRFLSGWRITKNQAWVLLFALRDGGYLEYHRCNYIKIRK